MDDWPIGRNEELCALCEEDGRQVGDSTRHATLECPYAAAVVDAIAKAYAVTTKCNLDLEARRDLRLKEIAGEMITGDRDAVGGEDEPFRVLAAEMVSALMRRHAANAKREERPPVGSKHSAYL